MNRDYKFIAHARTDIPALIAEVRRLRADADQSRRTARDFQEQAKKAGDECDRLRTALAQARREERERIEPMLADIECEVGHNAADDVARLVGKYLKEIRAPGAQEEGE